ncbi:hypothetical protein CEY12_12415 [Chryseobacterium sp. T16E-39]|uniref:hypothetical protein n=1 Tax=Chryseobacterium sp. T16E-39 TaxID=2015076 RepID=UPI000B5B384D|nr:hypothetical protein [Chryseobacterium sp. T16E-39]ASK30867.1 hypothetical protein CEY12_12415 [Chryseobacterium sp. T16E-39]
MKNLLNLFIVPVFVFCSFLQIKDLSPGGSLKIENSSKDNNQIGYLFFKVEKTKSGLEKITLESKKITDGKLKSTPTFDRNSGGVGDFIVSLTDSNGKEFVKQIVEDPLNQNLESFDKEGISRHKVSTENAEFSVRYSHSAEIQVVKVEKITTAGNQLLFNQKL